LRGEEKRKNLQLVENNRGRQGRISQGNVQAGHNSQGRVQAGHTSQGNVQAGHVCQGRSACKSRQNDKGVVLDLHNTKFWANLSAMIFKVLS
jgi:hypothetical protein